MLSRFGLMLSLFSPLLLADIGGTVTIPFNSTFDFDTGTVATTGGDVLWNAQIVPQGGASLSTSGAAALEPLLGFMQYSLSFAKENNYFPLAVELGGVSPSAIEFPTFNVLTNEGHYAKALITADQGSLTILYYTWEATNSSGTPAVMQVQNNYSYIAPGFPNYGIAPGSLFIIQGVNLSTGSLSALQSSAAPGLPLALNGASVSVTVNGVTTHPPIYYTSPGQLGVILPSNTPPGTGTITVTNGQNSSSPAPIQVVQSGLGLDSLYGTGAGPAVATDANGNLLSFVNSASPNQTIVLWGSGVGADSANDDRTFPQSQNNLTSIPFHVFIGGVDAQVTYRGRSQYPGVDQINVVVPSAVSTGCYVSVQAMSGTMASNIVTLSVAPAGGACSDPALGIGSAQAHLLSSTGTANVGKLVIPSPGNAFIDAYFWGYPDGQFGENNGNWVSGGSCVIATSGSPSGASLPNSPVGLDPGTITVTGAIGTVVLTRVGTPPFPGSFYAPVQGQAVTNPTPLTFDNGAGGSNVGHFNATITPIAGLTGSNVTTITSIKRSQGATVTWTGGAPGTLVQITGLGIITAPEGWEYEPSFTCSAPVEAGQFTIPPSVLLALPGYIDLGVSTLLVEPFTAPGLDWGYSRVTGSGFGGNLIDVALQ